MDEIINVKCITIPQQKKYLNTNNNNKRETTTKFVMAS